MLSVDGLHAVDLANFVKSNPGSALAGLSHHGITYSNASAAKPSDSFPGLLALVTGGSPVSTGVWYDDSYDRKLSAPGSNCSVVGTEVVYDESIDNDNSKVNGGGGINPDALPRDPANGCTPVLPHSFLRANTIFEVIRAAGGHTAWSDKHLSYELVNGPSGKGVDDLYTPEIAADYSAFPGIGIADVTTSALACEGYDELKVKAILNEIDGLNSLGTAHAGVPAIFGMNFQAVSVGQKVAMDAKLHQPGGYSDELGTPGPVLQNALTYVDGAIGRMVGELKKQGLFDSTLVIVSAKHGQSPIDRSKLRNTKTIPPVSRPSKLLTDAAQVTEDDISLIWLADANTLDSDLAILEANVGNAAIQKIFAKESLKLMFDDPAEDSRTPDIIVQPELGVIYTGNTGKVAEHGGFTEDDTHTALLLANPTLAARTIKSPVENMQVAPTILEVLGIDADALQSVRREGTATLPGLSFEKAD